MISPKFFWSASSDEIGRRSNQPSSQQSLPPCLPASLSVSTQATCQPRCCPPSIFQLPEAAPTGYAAHSPAAGYAFPAAQAGYGYGYTAAAPVAASAPVYKREKAHFFILYICVFKIMITELDESVQPKFSAPLKIQNHLHMTNQVILARKMNLNPNESVKWSLLKFTNSKRFLNGPAVSSNHTSYLSINLHNPKF